jgi:hypothetical protein
MTEDEVDVDVTTVDQDDGAGGRAMPSVVQLAPAPALVVGASVPVAAASLGAGRVASPKRALAGADTSTTTTVQQHAAASAARAKLARLDQTDPVDVDGPFDLPPALSASTLRTLLHAPATAATATAGVSNVAPVVAAAAVAAGPPPGSLGAVGSKARGRRRDGVDVALPAEERLVVFLKAENLPNNHVRVRLSMPHAGTDTRARTLTGSVWSGPVQIPVPETLTWVERPTPARASDDLWPVLDDALLRWAAAAGEVGAELDPTLAAGAWTEAEMEVRRLQRLVQLRTLYQAEYDALGPVRGPGRAHPPTLRASDDGSDLVQWRRARALARYQRPRRADAAVVRRAALSTRAPEPDIRTVTCVWEAGLAPPTTAATALPGPETAAPVSDGLASEPVSLPGPPAPSTATEPAAATGVRCRRRPLPGSLMCVAHILWDARQQLYMPCRGDGVRPCVDPVLRFADPPLCPGHRYLAVTAPTAVGGPPAPPTEVPAAAPTPAAPPAS